MQQSFHGILSGPEAKQGVEQSYEIRNRPAPQLALATDIFMFLGRQSGAFFQLKKIFPKLSYRSVGTELHGRRAIAAVLLVSIVNLPSEIMT